MNPALATAAALFAVAVLYSSVGHAGASGYLAVLALVGLPPGAMKPTALVLNLVVATVGAIQFTRAGHFAWRTFWPFALASVPAAWLGGAMKLPVSSYKAIVGVVLVLSAIRLLWTARIPAEREASADANAPPLAAALPIGAGLGFLSGLTGVGGGIFLSPVLLLFGWASAKRTAAVSVWFILVNSAAGLLGHLASLQRVPADVAGWAPTVLVGGLIGSTLGSRFLPGPAIRRLLAVVLVLAGAKLLTGR
ncbi:MAG: sulfite exporter TauE/SafE family protein [Candidatus Eisenbacteria bacterium]